MHRNYCLHSWPDWTVMYEVLNPFFFFLSPWRRCEQMWAQGRPRISFTSSIGRRSPERQAYGTTRPPGQRSTPKGRELQGRCLLSRTHLVVVVGGGGGSGGGVFLACEDFGRTFDQSFPASTFLFLFFEVEISSRTLLPLLRPGSVHSGSAS